MWMDEDGATHEVEEKKHMKPLRSLGATTQEFWKGFSETSQDNLNVALFVAPGPGEESQYTRAYQERRDGLYQVWLRQRTCTKVNDSTYAWIEQRLLEGRVTVMDWKLVYVYHSPEVKVTKTRDEDL